MREHMGLFRGKRIDNGEWVEGCLLKATLNGKTAHLIFGDNFGFVGNDVKALSHALVAPATIGECTSLKDKNGKLIFEGDIFRMDDDLRSVVIFKDGCFRFQTWGLCGTYTESGYDECGGGWGVIECDPIDWYYIHDMGIAGNAIDNPELKGGEG